jgi:hypothetical protein
MLVNFSDTEVGAVYGRQTPREGWEQEGNEALSAMYGTKIIIKDSTNNKMFGFLCALRGSSATFAVKSF